MLLYGVYHPYGRPHGPIPQHVGPQEQSTTSVLATVRALRRLLSAYYSASIILLLVHPTSCYPLYHTVGMDIGYMAYGSTQGAATRAYQSPHMYYGCTQQRTGSATAPTQQRTQHHTCCARGLRLVLAVVAAYMDHPITSCGGIPYIQHVRVTRSGWSNHTSGLLCTHSASSRAPTALVTIRCCVDDDVLCVV